MIVIGLTGGIGSGKSEVSRKIKDLGAEVIDADLVGHEAYLPHTPAWEEVVATFGQEVLQPSGEVDRRKLGGIVFSDPKALAQLNAIMHPRIFDMICERIEGLEADGFKTAVVEAALLIEANWTSLATEVWVLTSSEEDVIERLLSRSNMTEETTRVRIASQLSQSERVTHAHVVIKNDGDLGQLKKRVEDTWRRRAPA